MTDFDIRAAQGSDLNFIYKTLLDSFRYDSTQGKACKNSVFYTEYQRVLDHILSKSLTKVIVACHLTEPTVIYGYLIYEPGVFHYAFVKESFRNLGIAKSLFNLAFGEGATAPIQVTHKTRSVESLVRNHTQLIYNPFLLYQTHKE